MIDTGGAATLDGDVKLINGIEVLTTRAELLEAARAAGVPVFYTEFIHRSVRSVVRTGMITQGCLLHTHADALMQGFYPVVARDGVGSYEQDWHELAMRWMARKSPVYSVSEISAEWSEARAPE